MLLKSDVGRRSLVDLNEIIEKLKTTYEHMGLNLK